MWSEGASAFAHEREALAFVRERLPNHEPYRAWSNVEFIADDGSINEVDLLVVAPHGFLLIEIKSWPGKLFGDGQRWRLVRPNGKETSLDHPVILANTKAQRLRSLLARQKAFKNEQVYLAPRRSRSTTPIRWRSMCSRSGRWPICCCRGWCRRAIR